MKNKLEPTALVQGLIESGLCPVELLLERIRQLGRTSQSVQAEDLWGLSKNLQKNLARCFERCCLQNLVCFVTRFGRVLHLA